MFAEYKRDVSHNYLILHGDETINTTSYQVRILTGNTMSSILKCRMQGLDGTWLFYYDITSKQSLASFYEQRKLQGEDLEMILRGFLHVIEEMAEFLLNTEQLVLCPEYIFLDEPTLGLDIVIAKEIRKVIHELAKKDDKGILLTTHYISEAEELCDYIYILDNGKIIAQGTKEELKELFNCKPKVVLQEPGLEEILMKIISDSRGDGNEKKSVSN